MKKIYVKYCSKRITEDDFEHGENPETTTNVVLHEFNGFFNSLDSIADELNVPKDKQNWMSYDDGRIICQTMENRYADEPSEHEMKNWKDGKIVLYAVEYELFVDFIESVHTPTMKEIVEYLGIEAYD